ncbi:MAG TPA: AI-2E family transporter, partial [Bryobacteraceae bacterium]|nr:AI-2E family transporter [Bryobacteraceae bacterium]
MELLTTSLAVRKPKVSGNFLAGLVAVIALLYFGRIFFITVTIAVILAFILDPLVGLFMRMRIPRGLASFFTCSLALLVVYFSVLAFYTQSVGLLADLPAYSQRINEMVDGVVSRLESTERSINDLMVPKRLQRDGKTAQIISNSPAPPNKAASKRRSAEPPAAVAPTVQEVRLSQEREPIVNMIYAYLRTFYDVLLMASFVPFLVYFMLSWRDHLRRSFLHIFEGADRMVAGKSWEGIADMARAYVVGNFILGMLLSVVSSILFWGVGLPFPLLIGPISAFLSLIPYVGLPLALIPPFFAALPIHTKVGFYLITGSTVAFLHLLALNLLYPKLVGARVHLNPLAVTLSLMFWGTLWGAAGLVLGIPITAGIKAVCDNVRELEAY